MLTVLLTSLLIAAAGDLPATPGERGLYARYTLSDEIAIFLSDLDARSDNLVVRVAGRSRDTAERRGRDLLLCILTANGASTPSDLDRKKPTLLLFASQHGNEQSAKEAALVLIRDLAVGESRSLLDEVNVLVMPQMNPYGNWADQRRNERDLDLNRDHVKLEAPATVAIHRIFRDFMPEVTVDAHEKGDDYYRASFGCVSNLNIDEALQATCRGVLLAEVATALEQQAIPFHEYLVRQPMGIESAAGAALPTDSVRERETMTRYSTTDLNDGRNSLGIYQTLSLIFEGASRHDLASLGERTAWQRAAIGALLTSVARHGAEIVGLVHGLRRELLGRAAAYSPDDRIHLRMEYARSKDQPTLALRRFADAASDSHSVGVLTVDKKAGETVLREELESADAGSAGASPRTTEEVVANWFPQVTATRSVTRPLGYVISTRRLAVIETLLRHRIRVEVFTKAATINVESYRILALRPAAYDYLAPVEIETELLQQELTVSREDFFVPIAQPAASLIPALLEPASQYGLIRYQSLDLVPEVKARFAFHRYVDATELPTVPYKPW